MPERDFFLSIRQMRHEDVECIARIEELCFPEDPWPEFFFHEELDNRLSHGIVAVTDRDLIVGYGIFWFVIDEGHIMNVAVHPNWRGKGIGRWLMVFMLELIEAMGGVRTLLEVRLHNKVAQGLYESLGFKRIGLRKRYYSDGEDAILMLRGRQV